MNVLIMTDMEGISGVDTPEQITDIHSSGYQFARQRLMLDTNSAIAGAFSGGADQVYVVDGHGTGCNFIPELLDPRAERVMIPLLTADFMTHIDAYMEVGIHPMAGTLNGFLDHTQSSAAWYNYYINGRRCGEIAQGAVFCGSYGIPFVMVSGDEAACEEARQLLGPVACAAVKQGVGRNRAKLVDLDEALDRIQEAARSSLGLIGLVKPYKPDLPLDIKLELYRSDMCDDLMAHADPAVERLGARSVRKTVSKINRYCDLVF
ncbi:MAG: M55 family metallopeptidase [Clostridiaceae bacterium]|nr:M55 family metallopeptidase [Clostridiaceae bacterium]